MSKFSSLVCKESKFNLDKKPFIHNTKPKILNMNSTHNETFEIGGIHYFLLFLDAYLPYVTITIIGALVGVLGNILIIGTVCLNKELHNSTNMLIFNLSVIDLLLSAFVNSTTVIGKQNSRLKYRCN